MTNSRISRLMALSDAEFGHKRPAPIRQQRFKPISVNLAKINADTDRQHGAAVRLMATVLSLDSDGLSAKVSTDPETAATFRDAIGWLIKEAAYHRKTAGRMDLAISRLSSALTRYRDSLATDTAATASETPPVGAP